MTNHKLPYATLGTLASIVAGWLFIQGAGVSEATWISSVCSLGLMPAELFGGQSSGLVSLGNGVSCELGGFRWRALFRSLWIHVGWLHVLLNSWYLQLYGRPLERRLGSVGLVMLFVSSGVVGGLVLAIFNPKSIIVTIGASGSIAGVMGGLWVTEPDRRVPSLLRSLRSAGEKKDQALWQVIVVWLLGQFVALGLYQGRGPISVASLRPIVGWEMAAAVNIAGFASGAAIVWGGVKLFQPRRVGMRGIVLEPPTPPSRGWW